MFRFYFNRIKSQCRIKCELLVTLLHGGTVCIDATRQFQGWVLTTLLMSQVGLKDRQGWGYMFMTFIFVFRKPVSYNMDQKINCAENFTILYLLVSLESIGKAV